MSAKSASDPEDLCQVCCNNTKKYKCPACTVPYCSLSCFKSHKAEGGLCQERQDQGFVIDKQPSLLPALDNSQSLLIDEIPPEHILDRETLDKLGESVEVKNLLSNSHLRGFLKLLNGKDYPRGLMRNAMQEPLFIEFANACLKAIHPEQQQDQELTDEQIVDKIRESVQQQN